MTMRSLGREMKINGKTKLMKIIGLLGITVGGGESAFFLKLQIVALQFYVKLPLERE